MAAVPVDDSSYRCETDPGSREVRGRVKPLKWREQFGGVGGVEADTVVTDIEDRRAIRPIVAADLNLRVRLSARELPRVVEKILEQESAAAAGHPSRQVPARW